MILMIFLEMEHDWFEHHQCARLLHVHGHLVAQAGLLKHTVMWWHLPMHAGGWTICGLVSIPQVLWGEAAEPTLPGRAESHALRAFSSSSPFRRWWGWRRQNRRCKWWGQKEDNGESRTRKTWERDEELKGKAAVYRKVQEVGALWMFIADISVFFVEFTRDAMSFIKTHVFFTTTITHFWFLTFLARGS